VIGTRAQQAQQAEAPALSTGPGTTPALAARNVSVAYRSRGGGEFGRRTTRWALDDVSIEIWDGEIVALVGESGCGKSTLAKVLLGLLPPSSGEVEHRGKALSTLAKRAHVSYRNEVQVVFQDPAASLNPRQRVWQSLSSILEVHGMRHRGRRQDAVLNLLSSVGLDPPDVFANRFPHELSGGQQQRIAIARAFAMQPRVVIADEPLSALDVSVQAQILDLMIDHQRRTNAGYLVVTHDLNVVRAIADRVVVMYLGRVVESGNATQIFDDPRHPYTRALLASRLSIDPSKSRIRNRPTLVDDPPTATAIPAGCAFHPRCPLVEGICTTEVPALLPRGGVSLAACHLADK
jgi:oligopeptide/dipeptide ABC transporter ATP-binding protein